ncbi:MAG: acetyl-CoA carboxylase biotin carboxyl carrier protein subunit [Pyrinomonas sp.]|uniref:biotin/lipoyl-containing protein n=1 Tax=Pyrinomonas sp. TaxID=2080306 RepID=UPI00331CA8A8
MKLLTEIEGEQRTLDLEGDGERLKVELDGRLYEIEVRRPEAGIYLLLVAGRVYECRVRAEAEAPNDYRVHIRGRSYSIRVRDPRRLRNASGLASGASGRAAVTAPMPGKVVRVLAEQGAQVEAGAGLVVVEAMKMQNEMKSPKSGKVVELRAREGMTVNAGDVLAIVE